MFVIRYYLTLVLKVISSLFVFPVVRYAQEKRIPATPKPKQQYTAHLQTKGNNQNTNEAIVCVDVVPEKNENVISLSLLCVLKNRRVHCPQTHSHTRRMGVNP